MKGGLSCGGERTWGSLSRPPCKATATLTKESLLMALEKQRRRKKHSEDLEREMERRLPQQLVLMMIGDGMETGDVL